MRRIAQRNSRDCGIACIAMIADMTYDEALHAVEHNYTNYKECKRGLVTVELIRILKSVGLKPDTKLRRYKSTEKGKMILKVDPQKNGDWHWVVRTPTGKILDPDHNPALKKYKNIFYAKKQYNVTSYLRVE
jgi:ABC-type bacteriocin/lantibiotic exporter with double-glycine peptidase domain